MWRTSWSTRASGTDRVATTVSDSSSLVSLPSSPERTTELSTSAQTELSIVWSRFRRHHFALVGLGALFFMLLISTLAPLLAPYGPNDIDRAITDPAYIAHGFAIKSM